MGRMKLRPPREKFSRGKRENMLAGLLDSLGVDATAETMAAIAGELDQPPPDGDFSKIHTPAMKALIAKLNAEDDANE